MKAASIFLVLMVVCAHSLAMFDDAADRAIDSDKDEICLRLVFLGKTGAGKSTAINACYNFVQKTRWNDYPKWFPIPTEYQECNVENYRDRGVECHEQGQLNAVTQKPSEYVAIGDGYKVSFIDCPGTADPRGVDQDNQNIIAAAEFLEKNSYCNAFCLVLKSSTNRETVEELYGIDQIKSILPLSARNRIFILVTHDGGDRENILSFVQSVGLPTDNIFYLDNFALTREGHVDLCTINMTVVENDEIGDPFSGAQIKREDSQIAIAKKARATWLNSHREFNKMIRRAKELGVFCEPWEFTTIKYLKHSIATCVMSCVDLEKSFEESETRLETAKKELASAVTASEHAQEALLILVRESSKVGADSWCCERRWEWAAVKSLNSQLLRLKEQEEQKRLIHLQAWAEKERKSRTVECCEDDVSEQRLKRDSLIDCVHFDLADLSRKTMCSSNSKVCDYYDVCIRREQNSEKRARLCREKKLYQILLSK